MSNRQNMASNALVNKEQLNVLYKEYTRKRGKLYRTLQGKGLIYGGFVPKTSYEEFKNNFMGAYGKLADKGLTPTTTQVIKEMIDNELYTASEKEVARDVKALGIGKDVVRAYGGLLKTKEDIANFDLNEVPEQHRAHTKTLMDNRTAIMNYDDALKAQGLTGEERAKAIGVMFFGSPE
jgi:hypothetical protein